MLFKSFLRRIVPDRYQPQAQRIYFTVRALWYSGRRFTCPCCNGHFRTFLPFGINPRLNAQCPRCGSLERHRLLWLYLRDRTNFFKDKLKVLDIAPVPYLAQRFKALPNLNYVDADMVSPSVAIRLDITAMPLLDNQFDGIICYHVLEHVPDDRKAMRELFRVLKPGGWAILQSPVEETRQKTFEDPSVTAAEDRARVFGQWDHVRIYGLDYKNRLQNTGFTVTVDDYIKQLPDELVKQYGLEENENVYLCIKPDSKTRETR
ncbi:MAG: methyltransferase domain-containing protein [Chloroflexi bacterium]|nr:methyltransferase domain-containing protein [Chloroflexota bacterium]